MLTKLYRIVDQGDPCALVLLIGILAFLGSKTAQDRPRLQRWGALLSVAAFVLFCAEYLLRAMPHDAWGLLRIASRGLLLAGLTLGASWTILPLVAAFSEVTIGELMKKAHAAAEEAARRNAVETARREEAAKREERQRQEEEIQRQEEERRRQAAEAPPPPTRAERVAAVEKDHNDLLEELTAAAGLDEVELKSAREQAKLKYLKDLNNAMQ